MAEKKIFKISDEQIKQMYLSGKSLSDIAKIAQDTKGLMALKKRLNDLGVDTSYSTTRKSLYREKLSIAFKKYQLNHTKFDVIDTEEKAYWLGWYMTDGYNHESKSAVALRLQGRDIEILEKLKSFLETDTPIYTFYRKDSRGVVREYVELNICSVHMSKTLASYGVIQNKMHNKSVPNLPSSLVKHFLRGYFDGDGCFSVNSRKDRRNGESLTYQVTFSGNKEPLLYIKNFIAEQLQLGDRVLSKPQHLSYTLHYGGRNICYKILDWIYQDATIYLKRKHDKYLQYRISAE